MVRDKVIALVEKVSFLDNFAEFTEKRRAIHSDMLVIWALPF